MLNNKINFPEWSYYILRIKGVTGPWYRRLDPSIMINWLNYRTFHCIVAIPCHLLPHCIAYFDCYYQCTTLTLLVTSEQQKITTHILSCRTNKQCFKKVNDLPRFQDYFLNNFDLLLHFSFLFAHRWVRWLKSSLNSSNSKYIIKTYHHGPLNSMETGEILPKMDINKCTMV